MAAGTQIGNVLFTDIGGVASRMLAEEALNAGEIVSVGTVDNKVVKTPASGKIPIGVVFENALINADVWVVTSGIASILPEAGITAARGEVAFTSASTAGRAAQSATDASRKVGTWLANGTGNGVITKAALQLVGVDAASLGGGSVSAFTWSAAEQTWPFEKASDGSDLYARMYTMAGLVAGVNTTASGFTAAKLHHLWGTLTGTTWGVSGAIVLCNYIYTDNLACGAYIADDNSLAVWISDASYAGGTAHVYCIYDK